MWKPFHNTWVVLSLFSELCKTVFCSKGACVAIFRIPPYSKTARSLEMDVVQVSLGEMPAKFRAIFNYLTGVGLKEELGKYLETLIPGDDDE